MGQPAQKQVASLPDSPAARFDFGKPLQLAWWRLARGNFIGCISNLELVQVSPVRTRVDDGVSISGVVDSIALHPSGVVVVAVRCGVTSTEPDGHLKHLLFDSAGGQGAPL